MQKLLEAIENEIKQIEYRTQPPELYAPIIYLMDLGGKRLRPLLALLGYSLFKSDWETILKPALSVEIFHNFTLMHDDIMDNAPLRRGKLTVHEKWNTNTAILSGDVMLVQAYQQLLSVEPRFLGKIIKRFNECAAEVCEGQQLDMNFENQSIVKENEYIEMIRLKTAVLLGFSLELGGILAGENEDVTNQLRNFGEKIGIGFQLKDDWLDVFGEAQKVGKQVGGDIIANKKTFLLIKAIEQTKGENKKKLNDWLEAKNFDKDKKIEAMINIYNQCGISQQTLDKIETYFKEAFEILDNLHFTQEENKTHLKNFIEILLHRQN
ncbi:MAG: polyprenyl synthetase family protein [Cytophagia bacterium]|nr:MAG: polyprenyl synthetase family protein [Cytophagia bacterium]TAG42911.1 MAG: polyprenyl synthetase family protein [Cytophagia bacterium]